MEDITGFESQVDINELQIDSFDNLKNTIDAGKSFHIKAWYAYDGDDEKVISIWIEPNIEDNCTIMFRISRKGALFLAKSLSVISKLL